MIGLRKSLNSQQNKFDAHKKCKLLGIIAWNGCRLKIEYYVIFLSVEGLPPRFELELYTQKLENEWK